MQEISLLLCYLTLAVVSMDLALAIVLTRRVVYRWTAFCIVFTASLLGIVIFFGLDQLSAIVFSGTPRLVLHIIMQVILIADAAFVLVLITFLANWK